jgi:adenylosuccinate synthase
MRFVIAISGPIAVGKSAFIQEFEKRFRVERISTRLLIQARRPVPTERQALQEAGEALDRETDGKWVADDVATRAAKLDDDTIVIVDSVRIARQVEHLRATFGKKVGHVHLTASDEVLTRRFLIRKERGDPAVREFATHAEVRANPTEAAVEALGAIADARIETDDLQPEQVATTVAERLKLSS